MAYQNHMLSSDINFQLARNLRLAAGNCTGTVGLDPNNVDGDREVDFPNKISQKEERSSGDADDHRGGRGREGTQSGVGGGAIGG